LSRVVRWEPDTGCLGPVVACIGMFDGVHVGHQALISDTRARAAAAGCRSAVVTFDHDPTSVIPGCVSQAHLQSLEDRLECIARTGPDLILLVPFTIELSRKSAEEFIDEILMPTLSPRCLVVGSDFRLGAGTQGDVESLAGCGRDRGFEVVPYELERSGDSAVSATRVRALVSAGEMEEAASLLGRVHRLRATVDPRSPLIRFRGSDAVPRAGTYRCRLFSDAVSAEVTLRLEEDRGLGDTRCAAVVKWSALDTRFAGRTVRVEFLSRWPEVRIEQVASTPSESLRA
jgi:FAD synthase